MIWVFKFIPWFGNHTAYYKDTNEINTIDLLLKQYDNITTYAETEEIKLGNLSVLLIPWINSENEETSFDAIKSSKSKVAMGHLELNGFRVTSWSCDGRWNGY